MTDDPSARLAERLTAHLQQHPPQGVSLRVDAVEPIEGGVRVRFVTDQPMRAADLRVPEAVNDALGAALKGDVTLQGRRVEVRVDVEV
ncbi:MAG: hypothetical protein U0325_28245 [Polyangiales bacterium]